MRKLSKLGLLAAVGLCLAFPAGAQERIRLGGLVTLSGPLALVGKEQVMGLEAALKKLEGKLGGIPADLIIEDAKMTTETGQQAATKLIESDKVAFLVANSFSNQLLAYTQMATNSGAFVLSALPGPSDLAGP